MQQDNDPKNTSKSTTEWLKKKRIKVLHWPSQRQDLNLTEIMHQDLKRAEYKQRLANLKVMKQRCKEERAKIRKLFLLKVVLQAIES